MLAQILQGKAAMQGRVQQLISLRAAAKEQRAASLAGAASSMGGAAASGSLGGGGGQRPADPSKALQELLQVLAATLRHDVSKPEEGERLLLAGCGCRAAATAARAATAGRLAGHTATGHLDPSVRLLALYTRRPAAAGGAEGQPHLQRAGHPGRVRLQPQGGAGGCVWLRPG